MSLRFVTVENFSVFADEKISLAEGVNVFIGSNGTGKTQLLKGIYGCCEVSRTENSSDFTNCFQLNVPHHILAKDVSCSKCFFAVSDAHQEKNLDAGEVLIRTKSDERNNSQDKKFLIHYSVGYPAQTVNAVYIPVKDMLTHSKGLLSMANRYKEFPFDKTLLDIIDRAQRWTVKSPSPLVQKIIPILEKCIGGKISIENDEFYIVRNDGSKINFELEAEGFKKIGVLWQLLMNETIVPGSVLLWDEPEANLNPEYIPIVADTLLELGRNGVQIMLSTHSYILAKYLEIHKKDGDSTVFHSLYQEQDGVQCETKGSFSDLNHNSIMRAYEKLLDEVYQEQTGV